MPYKRAYKYKKRYKRPYKRGGRLQTINKYASTTQKVASAAFTALNTAKYIARFINTEVKFLDTAINTNSTGQNGAITALDAIPEGDTESGRSGTSVKPMRISWRLNATQHSSATLTLLRMVVFRGKYERDNEPVVGDIFASTGVNQFKINDKKYNTKFIFDRVFIFDAVNNSRVKKIDGSYKLFGHIQFDASQTDGTDHENGGVYVLFISNEATNAPTVVGNFRLTYTDN